jgi:hypothetical protein
MGVAMQQTATVVAAPQSARTRVLVALAAGATLLVLANHARGALYKWVDEHGEVHYTDKMPPEAVNKGNVELNKQAVPIKKTDPALTPEQLKAKAAEEERQRVLSKQQEEVARRDRALLASYTSENEIDLARTRALQTIDNVMQSAQAYSVQLAKRKEALVAKKTAAGDRAAANLDRELEMLNGEIERQADLVAQKKREAATVTAKYDADKARWRELVAAKSANVEPMTITQPEDYPGAAPKK